MEPSAIVDILLMIMILVVLIVALNNDRRIDKINNELENTYKLYREAYTNAINSKLEVGALSTNVNYIYEKMNDLRYRVDHINTKVDTIIELLRNKIEVESNEDR